MVGLSSTESYIHKQALVAALINMMVNPLLAFLLNRNVESVALPDILIDMIITLILITWLVTSFSVSDVNRQIRAGDFKGDDLPRPGPILLRLPKRGALLVMVLFVCTALVMVTLTVSLSSLFGITELSVDRLALFKASLYRPGCLCHSLSGDNSPAITLPYSNSLTEKELDTVQRTLEKYRKLMKISFTGCRCCMPCPAGVNIPGCFELYNSMNIFKNKIAHLVLLNYFLRSRHEYQQTEYSTDESYYDNQCSNYLRI